MSIPTREPHPVLLGVLAFLLLTVLALAVVARVTQAAMRRLRLEPMVVLFYFGLTDGPADELAARRIESRARARRRHALRV